MNLTPFTNSEKKENYTNKQPHPRSLFSPLSFLEQKKSFYTHHITRAVIVVYRSIQLAKENSLLIIQLFKGNSNVVPFGVGWFRKDACGKKCSNEWLSCQIAPFVMVICNLYCMEKICYCCLCSILFLSCVKIICDI